jgi:virginiamycin B lyase
VVVDLPLPAEDCRPDGISIAPDGAVWFYEERGLSVDRLEPDGGLVRFAVPACGPSRRPCRPSSIALGRDGTVWFAEHPDHWLGMIRPDGTMTEVAIPRSLAPCILSAEGDGGLWFADCAGSAIGRLRFPDAMPYVETPELYGRPLVAAPCANAVLELASDGSTLAVTIPTAP